MYESHLSNRPPLPSPLAQVMPPVGWSAASEPVTPWIPRWEGLDDQRVLHLQRGHDRVMLFLGWYGAQRQGAELVNFDNQLVPQKHPIWRKPTENGRSMALHGQTLDLREAKVDSPVLGQQMRVWYWNRLPGESTTSPLRIKLALGLRKLQGKDDAGAVVIVAAPYQDRPEDGEAVLRRFVADLLPTLDPVLDKRGP
jgi:EpsI family protein